MYIETVPNRNSKPAILLRESWREGKTIKKRTLANLSSLPTHQIDAIKRVLKNEALVSHEDVFTIHASYLHGHIHAAQTAMKQLQFPALIAPRTSPQRDAVIAMIIARLLHPSSKLAITRWWRDTTLIHSLPSISAMSEDDLYEALDWLLLQQPKIEKKLAKRHLMDGELALYDMSSSYVEGECCPLACYGYSRDQKRGKKQINYGLLTNRQGCPIAIEVFPGNTKDSQTLLSQVDKLKKQYRLKQLLLAGDRGMITQAHIKLFRQQGDIYWVTALKSQQIRALFNQSLINTTQLSQQHLLEISDEQTYSGERLIVCYNHALAQKRRADRLSLMTKTQEALTKIQTLVATHHLTGKDNIGLRVGKVINQFKVGKLFQVTIEEQRLQVESIPSKIQAEQQVDGVYIIRTNVPVDKMTKEDVVRSYKQLTQVEQAFRRLKTVSLALRPIYHYAEHRVKAHVFLCLLSYYIEWHMRTAWKPLLFSDEDIARKQAADPVKPASASANAKEKALSKTLADGSTAYSYESLLHHLSTIVRNLCYPKNATKNDKGFMLETKPNQKQTEALQLLKQISVPSSTHS